MPSAYTTQPDGLTQPITPSVVIDDFQADVISVILSPEIPLSSFSLKASFQNIAFKNDSKKAWANVLRDIADELDKQG